LRYRNPGRCHRRYQSECSRSATRNGIVGAPVVTDRVHGTLLSWVALLGVDQVI
jgi:hypothetical protein